MKIYLSVDMEGITGVSSRDEVTMGEGAYRAAQQQMTAETAAAVRGALMAGAKEIWVKDAHWTGRNIEPTGLPSPDEARVRLIRGWSGHPFSMVEGLDETFDGVAFVGYHSAASRAGNPLSHTLASRLLAALRVNGELTSEFQLFAWAAALVQVPVLFLAGDEALCAEARGRAEGIATVATFQGRGAAILTEMPADSLVRIERGVAEAVRDRARKPIVALPEAFKVRITFRDPAEAYRRSFYPGCRWEQDTDVTYETTDGFELLRLMKFMTLG